MILRSTVPYDRLYYASYCYRHVRSKLTCFSTLESMSSQPLQEHITSFSLQCYKNGATNMGIADTSTNRVTTTGAYKIDDASELTSCPQCLYAITGVAL
jgi:hypothetical protein